jgi:mitochondrial fission protein ELM1
MLLEQVRTILERETSVAWTASSSPRTPQETIDAIENLARNTGNFRFYRAGDTPAGWIEEQYKEHAAVWVTADSISMIFEAITAGCRVGILPVEWTHVQGKFKRCVDHLIENRWVTPFESWTAGSEAMIAGRRLDEAARCANEILRRWWPDRLP